MTDMAVGKKEPGKKMPDEKHTDPPVTERSLRDTAEEQLARVPKRSVNLKGQTPDELIHELQVHQIELETQAEELRKAHFALEESRDRFLDLYEFAPVGYLTLSDKGLITEVNLTGAVILGVERNRLLRARFSKSVAKKDSDEWHRYFTNVLNRGEKQSCTLMLKRGDGTTFPARLEGGRLTGTDRAITVRIAISDITDIWQIAALRESEEKYRNLYRNSALGIFHSTFEGRFIDVNPALAKLLGYNSPEEAVASITSIADQVYVDPPRRDAVSTAALEAGGIISTENHYRRRDGPPWYGKLHLRIVPDHEGRPGHYEGFVEDITERRRAEEALRQANRKLSLLSGVTRHDISNQLTVLQGYLRILEKKQPDLSHIEYFRKLATAAQRISAMIQFTREYEQIGIKAPAWQDCRMLVETAAQQAHLGKIIVKNDLPAGTEVFADPLIAKLFHNLLDNAVRHGGKITTLRFSVEESGDNYLIVCEDDGGGVPEDEKERIFERGFGKNTGLGLALSREILDITGITIRETGEPGTGARFEIKVPKGAWRMAGKGD